MPYLDADTIDYPELRDKKYDAVKANILKMYVQSFEEAYYQMDEVYMYPNQR